MNHTTKLLLLNILLFSAPALQAMGTVRTFGMRVFKGAAAAVPACGGLYSVYHIATKKEPAIEEMIEDNKRCFDQAMQCPVLQKRLKKLKESSNLKKIVSVPKGSFAKQILPLFTRLKNQDKKLKNIPLLTSTELGCGRADDCQTCDHRLVTIDPECFSYYDKDMWEFILAHELGHHYENHLSKRDEDGNAPSDVCHAQEYQADEYAARTIGSIEGALKFFDAEEQTDGKVAFNSWLGSFMNYFSEGTTHPSYEERVARLLALKKAGAFNKPYFMRTYKKNPELLTAIST